MAFPATDDLIDEPILLPDAARNDSAILPDELLQALHRMGLITLGEFIRAAPLTGGVSSDIWRVDHPRGRLVVKRALTRLRVEQEWTAPAERSAHEAAWLQMVARLMPQAAPALLGFDKSSGTLAISYLDPQEHPCWKEQLLQGYIDVEIAAEAGRRIGGLHARTAMDPAAWRSTFDDPAMFASIRLDPYFNATADRHPDRVEEIAHIRSAVEQHACAVIHGDVSPKNIHTGPGGPILLDAECATWSDPAFDLAFCLTHLFLKSLAVPNRAHQLRRAAHALSGSYLEQVNWESPADLEHRASRILTVLLLARVDGKSPIEYLGADDQDQIRRYARAHLLPERETLAELADTWIGFR